MFDQLRFNLAQIRNKSSSIVIRRRTRHRQQFWSPEGSQSWPWQSLAKTNASSVFPLTERINWTHSVSLFFHRFPMASNGNYTAHWVSMSFSVFWRVDFRNLQLHSGAEWRGQGERVHSIIEVWGFKKCSNTSVLLMFEAGEVAGAVATYILVGSHDLSCPLHP